MDKILQNQGGGQFSRWWPGGLALGIMASLLGAALGGQQAWGLATSETLVPSAAMAARTSLCQNGQVQVWGNNQQGQLGLGTTGGIVAQPTSNPYLTDVAALATSCNSFIRNEPVNPRSGETFGLYIEHGNQVQLGNPGPSGIVKNLFEYSTPKAGPHWYIYNDSGNQLDYPTFKEYAQTVEQNSYSSPGSTLSVINNGRFYPSGDPRANNCAADLFGNGIQQLRTAGKSPGQQPTARLEQNSPNPTTGETIIRYEVAAGTRQAELVLREGWNAKEVLRLPVSVTQQQVQLRTAHLPEGMYFYTLLVDGVPVQTKRMVIAY